MKRALIIILKSVAATVGTLTVAVGGWYLLATVFRAVCRWAGSLVNEGEPVGLVIVMVASPFVVCGCGYIVAVFRGFLDHFSD